jgi:ATP-dependent DNA helicase PIF1
MACEAWGLFHDDSEWLASFQEMIDIRVMPIAETRRQFALMLINLPAANAVAMFNHFVTDLCIGNVTPQSTATALITIQRHMLAMGRSLTDSNFGFDLSAFPDAQFDDSVEDDSDLDSTFVLAALPSLSCEQSDALTIVIGILESDSSRSVDNVLTIIARAGTGKSIWVHHVAKYLSDRNLSCICVAASALAATVLPRGRTAHAAFNIPVPCHDDTWLVWNDATKRRIKLASVIFWDEISMVSIHIVEAVNRRLQKLMNSTVNFGGKIICILGDFRQLAPIDKACDGAALSVTRSVWFQNAVRISFTFNFRAGRDPAYAALLERVGDGYIVDVEVPDTNTVDSVDSLITNVYREGITCYEVTNMILAITLDQCAAINEAALCRISGDVHMALASDDLRNCRNPQLYPPEYIASLNFGGVPPAQLMFKPHARFMIIKNYSPPDVCNGVLCELLCWSKFNVQLKLLAGPGKGRIVMLPRCQFSINESLSGLPFTIRRWQFPIIPAYAVTIHKSQGQTLSRVGLIIETDAFAHGLIYVALSRVSSWNDLFFFSPEGRNTIHNKVIRDLLPHAQFHNYQRDHHRAFDAQHHH